MCKIGNGIDIHRIVEKGNGIFLGGIFIAGKFSVIAHSDGDTLLHAISNAILSALGKQDIGYFFSNKDKKIKVFQA